MKTSVGAAKIRINLESETSELQMEVKGSEKVESLIKKIKIFWGDKDDYIKLHYQGTEMKEDQTLSAYNLIHGSVLKVKVSADSGI